jgi:hypothetical protein
LGHQHLTLCSQDHKKGVCEHAQGDVTVPSEPSTEPHSDPSRPLLSPLQNTVPPSNGFQ